MIINKLKIRLSRATELARKYVTSSDHNTQVATILHNVSLEETAGTINEETLRSAIMQIMGIVQMYKFITDLDNICTSDEQITYVNEIQNVFIRLCNSQNVYVKYFPEKIVLQLKANSRVFGEDGLRKLSLSAFDDVFISRSKDIDNKLTYHFEVYKDCESDAFIDFYQKESDASKEFVDKFNELAI